MPDSKGDPNSRRSIASSLVLWRAGVSAALLAIIGLQLAVLLRPGAPWSPHRPEVLVDDRGRPVYPYVLREVQNTISKNAEVLQRSYLEYLERSPAAREGRMTFDWYVTPQGRVENVEFVGGSMGDEVMQESIITIVEEMQFPPPGRRMYVDYTFNFKDVTE